MAAQPAALPAVIESPPSQLATIDANNQVAAVTGLIQFALEKGTGAAEIRELVELQLRVLALDQKAKFQAAKKALQAECPQIRKNKSYKLNDDAAPITYADLPSIKRAIRPLMDKHGFTDAYTQKMAGGVVTITCILTHEAGHSEEYPFDCDSATSAKMSSMQKAGSATTFGQRYALRGALGLQIGEDDDGRGPKHEAAEQKPGAPKVAPRDAPELQPIKQADLEKVIAEWKCQTQEPPTPASFAKWAIATVNDEEEWLPGKLSAWRVRELEICRKALGML
jgi:hypothetical protein